MWAKDGLNFPITFYATAPLLPPELERIVRELGVAPDDLGTWRREHGER